jgi:hypothetical protein
VDFCQAAACRKRLSQGGRRRQRRLLLDQHDPESRPALHFAVVERDVPGEHA